jgi:molecular chaperone DnaK (HSP70)
MDAEGRPALVPDCSESDVFHTPSAVHIANNAAFVGRMAEQLLEQDPTIQVVRFFKRLMGVPEPVCYDENGAAWYPEGVSALLLKKLAFDVEAMAHQPLDDAVITVPAHFNDPQRKATLAAATLADMEVLGLVEEPVAAALHYGVVKGIHDQVLLVYDFGGGTFDATAMSMDARGVYVLAKTGLTELGGKEIDEKVGAMILTQFERAMGHQMPMGARTLLSCAASRRRSRSSCACPARPACARWRCWGGRRWRWRSRGPSSTRRSRTSWTAPTAR